MTENGWNEYQKLVVSELKRLDVSVRSMRGEIEGLRLSVEILRTRAVTWGALGGFIVWLTTMLASVLLKP
jgi:hypothetical protein